MFGENWPKWNENFWWWPYEYIFEMRTIHKTPHEKLLTVTYQRLKDFPIDDFMISSCSLPHLLPKKKKNMLIWLCNRLFNYAMKKIQSNVTKIKKKNFTKKKFCVYVKNDKKKK